MKRKTDAWEKQQTIKENNRKGENVMLENKWNNIAPEVPQDFHEKFEETLRHIRPRQMQLIKNTKEKESVADY